MSKSARKSRRLVVLSAAASLALSQGPLAWAGGTTYVTTSTSGNWSTATWTANGTPSSSPGATDAGNEAQYSTTGVNSTLALDVPVTIGLLDNYDTGNWSITGTTSGFTLDNTGGNFNALGDSNAFIGTAGTGSLTVAPSLTIANTNLDIGAASTGAVSLTGAIGGTGNLNLINNAAGTVTLTGAVNPTGTITHSGIGSGLTTISGVIGLNVAGLVQNSTTSQLTLNAVNTFTGPVSILAGQLNLGNNGTTGATLGNGGTLTLGDVNGSSAATLSYSAGGKSATLNNPIIVAGGATKTLKIVDVSGALTFSGPITLNQGLTLQNTNGSTSQMVFNNTISGTGDITLSETGNGSPITLSGSSINNTGYINNIGTNGSANSAATISGALGAKVLGVTENGSTQLILSGANGSYAGTTSVLAGKLTANSGAANKFLTLGTGPVVLNGGDLEVKSNATGSNQTIVTGDGTTGNNVTVGGLAQMDVNNLSGNTGSTFVFNNLSIGSGATNQLNVTGGNGYSLLFNGATTLTGNATFNPTTANLTLNAVGETGSPRNLTKVGTGILSLIGNNTYSGATTVSAGTLALSGGASLGGTAISTAAGATFLAKGNDTIGAPGTSPTLTIAGGSGTTGGMLSLADGGANTLTINSATPGVVLTMGGPSGSPSQLTLDVAATADQIVLGNGLSASIGAGGVSVILNTIGALSGTTQTLITAPGGGLSSGGGFFLASSGNYNGYTLALNNTDTLLTLTETANNVATPTYAYWNGSQSGTWATFGGGNANNTNFSTDHTGATNTQQIPGAATNVFFTVDNPPGSTNLSTTLGQNFTINSLSFTGTGTTAGTSSATIGGANTLTISASAGFTDSQATPVTYAAGTGIVVQPGAAAQTISAPVALGQSQVWEIDNAAANPLTVSGIVSGATFSLTKTGTGTLALTSSANTYSGGTFVNGGTLNATGNGGKSSLGTGAVTVNAGATLVGTTGDALGYNGAGPATLNIVGGTVTDAGTSNYRITLPTLVFTGGTLLANATNAGDVSGNYSSQSGNISTNAATSTATIAGGKIGLQANTTFTVAAGNVTTGATPGVDLLVSSVIQNYSGTTTNTLTKAGAGVMQITGTETYTGATIVNAGTLIASGKFGATAITVNAATLQIQNAALPSSDGLTLTNGSVLQFRNDNGGVSNATITQGNNVVLSVANEVATIDVNNNGGSATGNTISMGTLNMGNGGNNSTTLIATGGSGYGLSFGNVTLAGSTGQGSYLMPRGVNLSVGAVTGAMPAGTGTHYDTLYLDGTGAGVVNGVVSDSPGYAAVGNADTRITKQNTSTWTLLGANTYHGPTAVNGGTLVLGSTGSLGTTAVTVGSGATFASNPGSGTNAAAGPFNFNPGAAFSMVDGATGMFDLTASGTSLTVGGTGIAPNFTFEINPSSSSADELVVSGAASVGASGGKIFLVGLGTAAPVSGSTYTIMTAASGLSTGGGFTLGSNRIVVNGIAYNVTLNSSDTAESVTINGSNGLGTEYWTGKQGAAWNATGVTAPNATNWSTDPGGSTDALQQPGTSTDVYFTASGATNLANNIGASTSINSLNFTSTAGPVTIGPAGGGAVLTLGVGGITSQSAAAQTVNENIALGAIQTWTNAGSNLLTVGGSVSEGANRLYVGGAGNTTISGNISGTGGLTQNGPGTLLLSGANNFTGGLSILGGTLQVGSGSALGATNNPVTIASTATLDLNGQSITQTLPAPVTGTGRNGNGLIINSNTAAPATLPAFNNGANSFTIGGAGNITLTGLTGSSGLTLTKVGAGTVTLGGTADNAYLSLVVNSGVAVLSKASASGIHSVGSSLTINNGAVAQLAGTGNDQIYDGDAVTINNGTFDLNGLTETVGPLNSAAAGGVISNTSTTSNATLTVGGVNTTGSYAGLLQDGPAKTVALVKTGTGVETLTGASTYTGGTTVAGGQLRVNNTSGSGTGSGPVVVNSGATLGGKGTVAGTINVNGIIAAGQDANTVGKLTTTGGDNGATAYSQNWNSGGSFTWKLDTANPGTAGTFNKTTGTGASWDQLQMTSLSLNSTGFTVNVFGLGTGTAFDATKSYTWVAAIVSGNAYNSAAAAPIANSLALPVTVAGFSSYGTSLGVFSAAFDKVDDGTNTDLVVSYSPAPEPGSLTLLGLAAAGLLCRRRRRAVIAG